MSRTLDYPVSSPAELLLSRGVDHNRKLFNGRYVQPVFLTFSGCSWWALNGPRIGQKIPVQGRTLPTFLFVRGECGRYTAARTPPRNKIFFFLRIPEQKKLTALYFVTRTPNTLRARFGNTDPDSSLVFFFFSAGVDEGARKECILTRTLCSN